MTYTVGVRVNLECKIQNIGVFIAAKWIREEPKHTLKIVNISSAASPESSPYHKFTYVIKKVSTKDRGIYKCIANFYDYGPAEASYNLRVRGKWLHICPSRLFLDAKRINKVLCMYVCKPRQLSIFVPLAWEIRIIHNPRSST